MRYNQRPLRQSSFNQKMRLAVVFAMSLSIASCADETQTLTRTSPGEAEQIVAVLRAEGLRASTTAMTSGDLVEIQVDGKDLARATRLLALRGLPSGDTATMATAFGEPGLVETPLEERARLSHAISSELSATLRQIDGVLSARVHILVPEAGYGLRAGTPPTASVALRTVANIDESALLPQVRRIVAGAVPNLSYENVAVAVFPVKNAGQNSVDSSTQFDASKDMTFSTKEFLGDRLLLIIGAVIGIIAVCIGLVQTLGRGRPPEG